MSKESKLSDPRYLEKQKKSGAVEGIDTARKRTELNSLLSKAKTIVGLEYDPKEDTSTLSIGKKVIASGDRLSISQPEIYWKVPGKKFIIGQIVGARDVRDLLKGTQVYPQTAK